MEENLVGFLLGALDERGRMEVEKHLEQNLDAREQLARLKGAIAPLKADRACEGPPPDLTIRTLGRIAEHVCNAHEPKASVDLPQAPLVSPASLTGRRTWWRRGDVLVAACLLVMASGIILTVLGNLRGPSSAALVVDCKNNLRRFYTALQEYRNVHGQFPDITREAPRNVAGMVVPMLLEAGNLPGDASIRCPGNGPPMACQLTLTGLRALSDAEFMQRSPTLSMGYAYSLGYRDQDGNLHGPGTNVQASLSELPVMADRPPSEGVFSNSINHGGEGQNVLFSDGHVVFMPNRTFGDGDDIFVNRERKVAAGMDADDVVLGYSAARP